ncbi:MAG: alpha/beta hydrolase, partial [Chitinophagales bacterium]
MTVFKLFPTIILIVAHCFVAAQTSHFVLSDDSVKLHYKTIGTGHPILIINGGPGFSSDGFQAMATEIAKQGYQTILYDQRGTGQSLMEKTDSHTITMDLMTKDIEAIRKDLKIKEWVVLGHSFGGMMAYYYATRHPDQIKAIVASSSGGLDLSLLGTTASAIQAKLSPAEADSLAYWRTQRNSGENQELARRQYAKFLAPAYVYKRENIPTVAKRLTEGNTELNALVWRNLIQINYDCSEALKTFAKPVLIIQGKEDILQIELAEKADRVFPNSTLVLLDSCGHYGWLDQPEKYYNSIFTFLD